MFASLVNMDKNTQHIEALKVIFGCGNDVSSTYINLLSEPIESCLSIGPRE